MGFPTSCGFGFGPFGGGSGQLGNPFGHGPWVTFPYTPVRPFDEQFGYRVVAYRFEDMSEQRYLAGREQALAFVYDFGSAVDSATVAGVASWFVAAGGPATRFLAANHRTGSVYVVRFADADFTAEVGLARRHRVVVRFKAAR